MELFKIGFLPVQLLDIIDIGIVAAIMYMVYLRIKDTRAMLLIYGLLILLIAWLVAVWAHLNTLNSLIHFFGSVWLISIVVIFAPELRRLLIQIGRWPVISVFYPPGAEIN